MLSLFLASALTWGVIPVNLTTAIIQHESGGVVSAISPAGAKGLMQITPIAVRDIIKRRHLLPRACKHVPSNPALFDPRTNVLIGQCFMKLMIIEFKGDHGLAIRSYNLGASRVRAWLAGKQKLPKETIDYHKRVMKTWKKLERVNGKR